MKSDYDTETLEDYEARPRGRTTGEIRLGHLRDKHKRERWRRIADGSQPAVISSDGHAYCPHSRERENARRLRQRHA